MAAIDTIYTNLTIHPRHFPDCCTSISSVLLDELVRRLSDATLVLSIGSGSGLLEQLLYLVSDGALDIYGIEVPSCINKYLPDHRMLRVATSSSLHPKAFGHLEMPGGSNLKLLFVYPRQPAIISMYMRGLLRGAPQTLTVFVISHKDDYAEVARILAAYTENTQLINSAGLPKYEFLVTASSTPLTEELSF